MKYVNAHTVLPDDLVEELQKYIQAGYIYIPAAGKKKTLGRAQRLSNRATAAK